MREASDSREREELTTLVNQWGGECDVRNLKGVFSRVLLDLIEDTQVLIESLRSHMRAPWATRPIRFAYTNSGAVNACAARGTNTDFIIVTLGAVRQLYGTMYGLMSLPTFLPSVGNAAAETMPASDFAQGFAPIPLSDEDLSRAAAPFCLPNDRARATFAMNLATTALQFLFAHEVGHVVAGHLELMSRHGAVPLITEFGQFARLNSDQPPRYVLEHDADAFATHFMALVELNQDLGQFWQRVCGWHSVTGREASFIALATAICVLFRTIGETSFGPEPLHSIRYPDPTIRSSLVICYAMGLAVNDGRFTPDTFDALCRASVFQVEHAWVTHNLPGQRVGESATWGEPLQRICTALSREYQQWQPYLSDYARIAPRWHYTTPSE